MGNACSNDREVVEKEDIYDFRYKGMDRQLQEAAIEDDVETHLPSYKEHLKSVKADPYNDKYPDKGESVFVLSQGFEREPVSNPAPLPPAIQEEDTVFEDTTPAPAPEPAPVQRSTRNFDRREHPPTEDVAEKVDQMNDMSKKGQEVIELVNEFQRGTDPDNDFNEVHGPYRYKENMQTYVG
jgi:hypothetical protein